jgi:hypothetical protein
MFAFVTVGVGAAGLLPLLPPPHAINDPIAVAIASHFILPPNQGANLLSIGSVRGPD